jgi:hypothetical protein
VAGQGGKTVGKTYNQLDERLHGWIAAQHIFFVATAPKRPGGHVNLSLQGHADTFAVLDERTVAYLGLTSSGAETAAHLPTTGASPSCSAPSLVHRGSCACMGRDGSSSPASNDGTNSQRGSRPAAAPVPLLWVRSSGLPAPAAYAVRTLRLRRGAPPTRPVGSNQDEATLAAYCAPAKPQEHQRPSRSAHAAGDQQAGSG